MLTLAGPSLIAFLAAVFRLAWLETCVKAHLL